MKLWLWIALSILSLAAGVRAEECCSVYLADRVEAGCETMYWMPMHSPVAFVVKTGGNRNEVLPFGTHYRWGVRPYLSFTRQCWEIGGSYIWYQGHDTAVRRSPVSNLQIPGINLSGSLVTGSQLFEYQTADFFVGYKTGRLCDIDVQMFMNGRWVSLERRQRWKLGAPEANVRSLRIEDSFRGGAVGIGLNMQRKFWGCMTAEAMINPLIAVGQQGDRRRLQQPITTPLVTVSELRKVTTCIPAISAKLGARLNFWDNCVRYSVRVGYSVEYYWNVLTQQQVETTTIQRVLDADSIGFAGPYIGIEVEF